MIRESVLNTMEGIKAVEASTKYYQRKDRIEARQAKKKKKTDNLTESQPPTSIMKAIRDENRTEAFKWLDSINKE